MSVKLTRESFDFPYKPGDVDVTGFGAPDSVVCVWCEEDGQLRWTEMGTFEAADARRTALLNSGHYTQVPG